MKLPDPMCKSSTHGFPGIVCPDCRELVRCSPGHHRYLAGFCINCKKKEVEDVRTGKLPLIDLVSDKDWISIQAQGGDPDEGSVLYAIPRDEVALIIFRRKTSERPDRFTVRLIRGGEVFVEGSVGDDVTFEDVTRAIPP